MNNLTLSSLEHFRIYYRAHGMMKVPVNSFKWTVEKSYCFNICETGEVTRLSFVILCKSFSELGFGAL